VDDDLAERRPELRFVPDRRYTALAAAGLVIALGLAVAATESAGRLVALVAAVFLAAYVLSDLLFSPRLVVSTEAVTINSPLLRTRLAWSQIEDVRADVRQRFGLRSTALEIDAGTALAVLSRRAIGADPEQAASLIEAFRPHG
jgi:hypothetical protein